MFLVLCPKWPVPAGCTSLSLFMLCARLLILSAGGMEPKHVCVCVCVCVFVWEREREKESGRAVTWPEHRALRFHEIVCIREVRKTKCYFLKSCDPLLTMSLWGEQTASHRGVNHSLMLLAAADTSTLLFLVPWVSPSALIFSECEDIYPHHNRSLCWDGQELRTPGWMDGGFIIL